MLNSKFLTLSLLLSSIFLSACDVPKIAEINLIQSTRELNMVKKAVRLFLRNPDTTKFENFQAAVVSKTNGTENIVACGYILAENAFGGFNGYAPFIYDSSENNLPLVIAGQTHKDLGFNFYISAEIVFKLCADNGIPINSINLN
jgi:hypothetical protein